MEDRLSGRTRPALEPRTPPAAKALVAELNKVKERGRTLGVIGTPNFFINGRLIKSVLTMKEIKDIIDPIIASGGATVAEKT